MVTYPLRLADLLARPFERVDDDTRWVDQRFIPELPWWPSWPEPRHWRRRRGRRERVRPLPPPTHPRVTVGWWKKNTLGRRVWLLGALCLDGHPVLVFQRGGREGDDAGAAWVLDAPRYVAAVRLLADRNTVRVPSLTDVRWRLPDLGNFYGPALDDPRSDQDLDYVV